MLGKDSEHLKSRLFEGKSNLRAALRCPFPVGPWTESLGLLGFLRTESHPEIMAFVLFVVVVSHGLKI